MIPENHSLITAYFMNDDRNIVQTEWGENGTEKIRSYIFHATEDNHWWNELLKYISIDEIQENTFTRIKTERAEFENLVMSIANSEGLNATALKGNANDAIDFIADWITADYNDEQIFKIKLRLFEQDRVKQSKDTAKKSAMRKAKTVMEILEAYTKF